MSQILALAFALLNQIPVSADRPARDADWHNSQVLALLRLSPEEGWRTTPSGLRYRQLQRGQADAASPTVEDTVTIHYVGSFIDGTEFDSSIARGEPATFPLSRLISGWQEGVPMMKVGDRFEFAIPNHLAYGPVGRDPIPGGAMLFFSIELLAISEGAGE